MDTQPVTLEAWQQPRWELFGIDAPRHGTLDGPWQQAFWVDLPGEIRSKSNARRYRRSSVTSRERWGAYKRYEELVAEVVAFALPSGWDLGPPTPAPLASRPAVVAFIFARSPLDAANLDKSVLDALQSVVYWNDGSVRFCAELGERTRHDNKGLVAFARLAAGASLSEVAAAGVALTAASAALVAPRSS